MIFILFFFLVPRNFVNITDLFSRSIRKAKQKYLHTLLVFIVNYYYYLSEKERKMIRNIYIVNNIYVKKELKVIPSVKFIGGENITKIINKFIINLQFLIKFINGSKKSKLRLFIEDFKQLYNISTFDKNELNVTQCKKLYSLYIHYILNINRKCYEFESIIFNLENKTKKVLDKCYFRCRIYYWLIKKHIITPIVSMIEIEK